MDLDIRLDLLDNLFDLTEDAAAEDAVSEHDIAIIGLSAKAGHAENADQLWDALCNGENFNRELPNGRASDANGFAQYLNRSDVQYAKESFLEQIDQFCPSFFHIPPKDAALLDPAQRMFLLSAWQALEDAGLSKQRLSGSETGVYVGYTTATQNYSDLLSKSNPEFADRALSGTVNSIIASRLSYYLNLKGPAIMVDTACSSSLVAVHLACNALRSGECRMAIVGSVKYTLIPEKNEEQGEVSVLSADGETRTFDVHSDGTNRGEGVAAVILKPLRRAIEEHDRIYAVIKGTAANQDGASVGITAPNAAAQEDVIVKAWQSAGVDPEQITYIEAHGTATKLGDPVEISGVERAFRRFTDKKQFCAIGSIKTNMGHLDCAAGIMGLVKCVLALKHKKLPPHLNFTSPNREIDFIHSPVYVNDTLAPWEAEGVRICGVSSFGMSGTNCHVVLQEYVAPDTQEFLPMLLPLSARNQEDLYEMAQRFTEEALRDPETLTNRIFTAAMAKTDYDLRYAAVIRSIEDLRELPERIRSQAVLPAKTDRTTLDAQAQQLVFELQSRECFPETLLQQLCDCYLQGANVDWESLYTAKNVRIVPIPGYPLRMERCWQTPEQNVQPVYRTQAEPLIDTCLTASELVHIYSTMMSEETHSEVREHIIGERNVLAGTVYVELLRSAASKMLRTQTLQIDGLVFMAAMIFEKGQTREVQTVLYRKTEQECEATVQSRIVGTEEWETHVQAKISALVEELPEAVSVSALLARLGENVMDSLSTSVDQMVTTGPRWKVQKGIWLGDCEAVTRASIEPEFAHELEQYSLYPSMLDASVNCSSVLNGDVFCLPYYYGSMRIYRPMPRTIYSHTVKNMESSSSDGELHVFDITIFDEFGQIIATVKDYAMKKAGDRQKKQFFRRVEPLLRTVQWVPDETKYRSGTLVQPDETTILVTLADRYPKKLYQTLKSEIPSRIFELVLCEWSAKNTQSTTYVFPEDEKGFVHFFEDMENKNPSRVIFLLPQWSEPSSFETLSSDAESLCHGFFHLMYAMASNKKLGSLAVDLLIPQTEAAPTPLTMLIAGMGKSLLFEYSRLSLRCILFSPDTQEAGIIEELSYNHSNYLVRLQDGHRFLSSIAETQTNPERPFTLVKGGSYLITGGTGGIGLVIAELFSRLQPDIRLILASRSQQLPPEAWGEQNADLYRRLHAMRQKGTEIICHSCDVADPKSIQELFALYPDIRGAVHAAGLPGGGFVIKRAWQDFWQVLRPKLLGTWCLVQQAEQRNMDFLVLFSSYSSVLAVAGQSDYIGANSYMDAYADYHNAEGRIKVINWSGWRESGMALANGVDMLRSPVQFLSDAEGADAFLHAMGCDSSRVLVGRLNYAELAPSVEDYSKVIAFDEESLAMIRSSSEQRKAANEQYNITVRGKETPLTATEEKVAQAWAKTLGLRDVHYQDRFLEIGGDSLSATYLQKEIEIQFPGTMDITDVFVYPTIEQMSTFIDSKLVSDEPEEEPMERLTQSVKPIAETITQETKTTDTDQMRKLLEMLASGEIDVSQAGQLL